MEVIDVCMKLKKKYLLILFTNQPDITRKRNSKINVKNINLYLKKKISLDYILVIILMMKIVILENLILE